MTVDLLLFDRFETLDAFGPAEMLSDMGKNAIVCCSAEGGPVRSAHGFTVDTVPLAETDPEAVLLIPGGMGTRPLVKDEAFLSRLKSQAERAEYVLTVCTGSALLARTGLLDGRRATSNKMAFDWVRSCSDRVLWQSAARWVADGKYYTASGVSAGIDMALGFLRDRFGEEKARYIERVTEYCWNSDPDADPYART
ncbi:MAG: DJ-1/PfpI family protein [Oscillospiraceae bacterium]|nr:DJ-1/PfpI family protein [Oscillospiraceae bacterium]